MYFSYLTVHPLLRLDDIFLSIQVVRKVKLYSQNIHLRAGRVLQPYASGMDTVPLALLLLLVWMLDSVMSSA